MRCAGVALLAGALGACRASATPSSEGVAGGGAASGVPEVELVEVIEVAADQAIEASGTLAPDEQVVVAAKVPGRLESISVDVATPVRQGQVIARIEAVDYELAVERARGALLEARAQLGLTSNDRRRVDPEATAIVKQARATLAEARANAERARSLTAAGLVTGVERDAAEAALVRAESTLQSALEEVRIREAQLGQRESDLASAEQRLADTALRAPFDGVVQARMGYLGEYFAPGAPIAQLVRVDPLRVRLTVPEREASRVQTGQTVLVRVEGDERLYQGRVARVAPSLDMQSRSLLVEADLKNPGHLRPGSFANCRILVGEKPAPSVPAGAIVTFAGLHKVIVVEDGKAVEKHVTIGQTLGDRVEIVTGLALGDRVVAQPGSLKHGQPVRVKPEA